MQLLVLLVSPHCSPRALKHRGGRLSRGQLHAANLEVRGRCSSTSSTRKPFVKLPCRHGPSFGHEPHVLERKRELARPAHSHHRPRPHLFAPRTSSTYLRNRPNYPCFAATECVCASNCRDHKCSLFAGDSAAWWHGRACSNARITRSSRCHQDTRPKSCPRAAEEVCCPEVRGGKSSL
jgi:hypothetical protein